MMTPFLTVSLAATAICVTPADTRPPSDLEALYEQGISFREFHDAAKRRVEWWHEHYASAVVADATVARIEATRGPWRLLVIAVDGCSDSANTIPYLAKLVDLAHNLEMRIVNSTTGRAVMEAHRTPDGRAATPTVLLLNERFEKVGCFVERPQALQTHLAEASGLSDDERFERKIAWYKHDAGRSTVEDVVQLVEGAAAGRPICESAEQR